MPAVKVTVLVEVDGVVLEGYPYVRRQVVDQLQTFDYSKADDGDAITFTTLPLLTAALQALVVRPAGDVTLRLDGQTDAGLFIQAGGILLALGVTANAGAATNATINNDSGAAVQIEGVGGGT